MAELAARAIPDDPNEQRKQKMIDLSITRQEQQRLEAERKAKIQQVLQNQRDLELASSLNKQMQHKRQVK